MRRRSAIFLGERHTSVFNRLIAKAIDLLVVVAILFLGKALWQPAGILAAALLCAFQDAMGDGQSVGKRIMGLRVVDDRTGQACSYRLSAIRNVPFVLAVVFGAIPWLWLFLLLIAAPLMALEFFALLSIESGIRLGDVLGNTLVVEYEDNIPVQAL